MLDPVSNEPMAFFEDKPKKKAEDRRGPPNLSFRPTERQWQYVTALEERGYERAEAIRRMLAEYIELEAGLVDAVDDIDAFAVAEGIVNPRGRRDAEDTLWLPRAIARLALKGLEASREARRGKK